MNKKLTNKDIINGAKCCAEGSCGNCPLLEYRYGLEDCVKVFVNYILYSIKENKSAPVATDTNSEVSKDTNSVHIDDSKLLDICQEELEKISEIALSDFPNTYLTEYVEYIKNTIKKLRGGDGNV